MEIFNSTVEYRRWREAAAGRVSHVASLGCLHGGHRSLMRRARVENDQVVVTLYVNPLQFAAGEDFDEYPRDPAGDASVCAQKDVDALLLLGDDEMYPRNFGTRVVPTVAGYEAASRPEHFVGVATVVTKLFNIVRPHRSYFGLKDYQQVQVVRRITEDLDLGVDVVGVQTEREPDGLAMSSRNVYLSVAERSSAPRLYLPVLRRAVVGRGAAPGAGRARPRRRSYDHRLLRRRRPGHPGPGRRTSERRRGTCGAAAAVDPADRQHRAGRRGVTVRVVCSTISAGKPAGIRRGDTHLSLGDQAHQSVRHSGTVRVECQDKLAGPIVDS